MFHYVIVGAGPAGCVLASRLSEDSGCRVLLIEAGPKDSHPFIHMPKGVGKMMSNASYLWAFEAYERGNVNTAPKTWIRGKGLGGSSSINGMMYVRGQPADYDELARLTSPDWNWKNIGAAFKALESHELGEAETRGASGPLRISMPTGNDPLMGAAIAAGERMGLMAQTDVNQPDNLPKIGYGPRTIFNGKRQNAAVAFLNRIRHRRNLTVVTESLVDKVIFDGKRAVGVMVRRGDSVTEYRGARIILSAGTLATPAILQRSGLGPADLLQRLDIPLISDLPEVGQNLQEHCAINMQWRLKRPASQNFEYHGWRLLRNGISYYLTRQGPLSHATFEVGAWLKTRPQLERPNGQFLIAPWTFDFEASDLRTQRHHGIQTGIYLLRPRSKGSVEIASPDARDMPKIKLDFFSDPQDRRDSIDLMHFARKMFAQDPLAQYIDKETRPGPEYASDDEIIESFRNMGGPAFHAVGSCRMGPDSASVVDNQTRVRGVENLHIVDLSVLPFVVAGNTYGPVAALAWRAAELIEHLYAGTGAQAMVA
jgi:choline dehydrogenase-like flavoprotein